MCFQSDQGNLLNFLIGISVQYKKCVQFFYITHLSVEYDIYTLAFPFDLRCETVI